MKLEEIDGKQMAVLEGAGLDIGWKAVIDGWDIILLTNDNRPVEVTYFGGSAAQDPEDNGETSSGVLTRNPHTGKEIKVPGCALPVLQSHASGTANSPLPRLPWGTTVRFFNVENETTIECPLVDNGPAIATDGRDSPTYGHAADLTRLSSEQLTGGAPDSLRCHVRILDAVHHLDPGTINWLKDNELLGD